MKKYDAKPLPPLDPNMDASKNHYWTYQGLDALLACKKPLTASKDEDLFIAVHQICEIAFHQIALDLDRTLAALRVAFAEPARPVGELDEALYFLERPLKLWDTVNRTMPILGDMRAFARSLQEALSTQIGGTVDALRSNPLALRERLRARRVP
jgi:tryptophan 2,3-dioxygenase